MKAIDILTEMVKNASTEIGFEFDEEVVFQVEKELLYKHSTVLEDDDLITWKLMSIISVAVKEWQEETYKNFVC